MRSIMDTLRALRKRLRILLRRYGGTISASRGSSRVVRRLKFIDLPLDLLHLIFEHLNDGWRDLRLPSVSHLGAPLPRTVYAPLIPLSTANRQMRVLIQPLLFRMMKMDPAQLPPPGVWPYIQYLHVYPPQSFARWEIFESFLLQMPELSNVYWHGRGAHMQEPLRHLRGFIMCPTLNTLTMNNIWLCEDGTDFIHSRIFLRALHIDSIQQLDVPPGFAASHLECIDRILGLLRPRLECLTLSGYSTKLSSLASAPWPLLRVFSVTRGAAVLDVPWNQLLQQMPQLCSLTIALERGEKPIIVCPPNVAGAAVISRLQQFTLSHPSPTEQVFLHLPPDLRRLSLRDSPRYYNVRPLYSYHDAAIQEPILKCTDVSRVFSMMSLDQLEGLELVYLEDNSEFEMLAILSQCCPNLSLLELHRYPKVPNIEDAWYRGKLSIPVESVADALAAFRSLRTLKLNFYFVDKDVSEAFTGLRKPSDYWNKLSLFLEAQAQIIARRVPFVQTLALLSWTRGGMTWKTWSVYHDLISGGADTDEYPHLVYEDVYDETYPGGMELDYF